MTLSKAQLESAQKLVAAGIPERFEGMSDDDALLVLMASGLPEEEARLALALNRGIIGDDGLEALEDGTVMRH